jgi:protein-S-isoprenylcysteine O-methyltransferase Ste14
VAPVAAVAVSLGSALTYWGMRSNRFFSSHVRIQGERGHVVVQSGPYAVVRHPGYAGAILVTLATPMVLGSIAALGLALLTVLLTVLRTWLEDETLKRELTGYQAYAEKVHYRLVPRIW